jgi:hypothetical protein
MRKASWIVLAVAGALTLLASLGSLFTAYRPSAPDALIPGTTLDDVAAGRPEVASALRARRGTAASFAAAYAVLFLSIVLGPYRRGDTWSWWALLAGAVTLAMLVALRIPALGTNAGVGAAFTALGFVVLGLLLDVGRVRTRPV